MNMSTTKRKKTCLEIENTFEETENKAAKAHDDGNLKAEMRHS